MATASQKNPNTDPEDFAAVFSNCGGGTCTGGGEGGAFAGEGASVSGLLGVELGEGLTMSDIGLSVSDGGGVADEGVMKMV